MDGQRSMLGALFVLYYNLFCVLRVQREIVVFVPQGLAAHLVVVSSANLTNRLELCDGVQLWVSRVKRRGLSKHPWGAPVFSVIVQPTVLFGSVT